MRSDVLGHLPKAIPGLPPPGYRYRSHVLPSIAAPVRPRPTRPEGVPTGAARPARRSRSNPQEQLVGVLMIQTFGDLDKGNIFKRLAYQAVVEEQHEAAPRP